jgi:hypothetical protein
MLVGTENRRDLQELQSSDERTEGAYLPQEAEMEVPKVRTGQDAKTGMTGPDLRRRL